MSDKKFLLETGKSNISFSEFREYQECPRKHYLKHIKHIDLDEPNVYAEYGKCIHKVCEKYVQTGQLDIELGKQLTVEKWKEFNFDGVDFYVDSVERCVEDIPMFLDLKFPNWEYCASEELLNEPIEKYEYCTFKGYVDLVLKCDDIYWLLDWKTSENGWNKYKKEDELLRKQLIFYKQFWSKKHNIPKNKIKTGFIILKYGKPLYKNEPKCDFVEVDFESRIKLKSLKILNSFVQNISYPSHKLPDKITFNKKFNGSNCKFCDYNGTEFCDGWQKWVKK